MNRQSFTTEKAIESGPFSHEINPDSQQGFENHARIYQEDHVQNKNKAPWASKLALYATIGALVLSGEPTSDAADVQPLVPIKERVDIKHEWHQTWVTNEPSGYFLGRVFADKKFAKVDDSYSGDYAYGAARGVVRDRLKLCGWVHSSILREDKPIATSGVCEKYRGRIKNRYSFGKGFNGKSGKRVDGKLTKLTKKCDNNAFFNYAPKKKTFNNLLYPKGGYGLYDAAGKVYGKVFYRYTTRDGKAAAMRTKNLGWVFMSKKCIKGYPKGGARKKNSAKAGPRPYKG